MTMTSLFYIYKRNNFLTFAAVIFEARNRIYRIYPCTFSQNIKPRNGTRITIVCKNRNQAAYQQPKHHYRHKKKKKNSQGHLIALCVGNATALKAVDAFTKSDIPCGLVTILWRHASLTNQ